MAEESRALAPIEVLREQLEARSLEYARALPSTIRPVKFQRVALTAVTANPELLTCSRASLLLSLMKCAQDGLVPDGKEAALVVFKGKNGPQAQYISMVAGVKKLVFQSGLVDVFEQRIVHQNDHFALRYGDNPGIDHVPVKMGDDPGPVVGAYSVATMRNGKKSYEAMPKADIDKVREVSRAKNAGPWVQWYEEMCKKTVAKRHAKNLPLSREKPMLGGEDELEATMGADGVFSTEQPTKRLTTQQQIDRLASGDVDETEGLEHERLSEDGEGDGEGSRDQ